MAAVNISLPVYQSDFTFSPVPIPEVGATYAALNQSLGEVGRFAEQSLKERSDEIFQANQFAMGADIINQSNDILKRWSQQNDKTAALNGYKKTYQDYADQVLSKVPDKSRLYTERLLFQLGQKGANELEGAQLQQTKLGDLEQFKRNMTSYTNAMQNAARRPDQQSQNFALSMVGNIHRLANNAAENQLISPSAAATYKATAHQNFEFSRIEGFGQQAVDEGENQTNKFKGKILTDRGLDATLSPTQRQALTRQIDSYASDAKFRLGLDRRQVNDMRNDVIMQVYQGKMPDPSSIALLKEADPENSDELEKELNIGYDAGSWVKSVKYAPLIDQLSALSEAQRPLTDAELGEPDSAQKSKARNFVAHQIATNIKSYQDDPATYIENSPNFNNQDNQLRTSILQYPTSDPRYQDALNNYLQQRSSLMRHYQQEMGSSYNDLSLIGKNDLNALAIQAKTMPQQDVPNFLNGIRATYGEANFPIILKNLAPKIGTSSMSIYNASINPRSAALFPDMIAAYSSDMKAMKDRLPSSVTESDIKKAFNSKALNYYSTFGNANGDVSGFLGSLSNDGTRIATYYMVEKGLHLTDAIQKSYDLLIGNNYNITNYKSGKMVKLPIDDDQSTHLNAMQAIQSNIIDNPPQDLRVPNWFNQHYSYLSQNERKTLYLQQEISNGYYINNQAQNGVVLVDTQGVPVQTIDGQKFGYLFADLRNPNSDAYKQINELEKKDVVKAPPWLSAKRSPSVIELATGQSLSIGDLKARTHELFGR